MSRTSLCIQMLEILSTGSTYKISELAELLETYPRNIIEYRKELELAGYEIITIPGKFGGYRLGNKNLLPNLKFTEKEIEVLNDSYNYMLTRKSFLNKKDYQYAMAKIMKSFDHEINEFKKLIVLDKDNFNQDHKLVEKNYTLLKNAIEKRLISEIELLTNQGKTKVFLIKPYDLYIYNEQWFVVCEGKDSTAFTSFKLSRIKNIKNTNKHFTKDVYFKQSDFLDQAGYKNNDEWFDIKLEISGYFILKLQENIVGKNQKVDLIEKNKAIFTAKMQYKFNIISFVLGLGSFCKVIEPIWLKDQIIKVSNEILESYKNN